MKKIKMLVLVAVMALFAVACNDTSPVAVEGTPRSAPTDSSDFPGRDAIIPSYWP